MIPEKDGKPTRVTRRKFIAGFGWAGLGLMIGAAGCAPSPVSSPTTAQPAQAPTSAPAVDKIVVGCWGGVWGEAIKASVGDRFEKEFGVKVEYSYGGVTERLAKMRAEAGNQTLDVTYWTPTACAIADRELKAVVPLKEKAELLPNMKELHDSFLDQVIWTDSSVAPWLVTQTLLYRTDKIPDEYAAKVDSWRVIFDPQWKGRIGWSNINRGTGMGLLLLAMLEGQGTIESGKPHEIDKAWPLAKQLKDQVPTFYTSDNEATSQLKMGETWISQRSHVEAFRMQDEGVPVRAWMDLKEGLLSSNESLSIIRSGNAAREDLAARFINMALSKEAGEVLIGYYFSPVNKNAQPPSGQEDRVLTAKQMASIKHLDNVWMAEQYDGWLERWSKELG